MSATFLYYDRLSKSVLGKIRTQRQVYKPPDLLLELVSKKCAGVIFICFFRIVLFRFLCSADSQYHHILLAGTLFCTD